MLSRGNIHFVGNLTIQGNESLRNKSVEDRERIKDNRVKGMLQGNREAGFDQMYVKCYNIKKKGHFVGESS